MLRNTAVSGVSEPANASPTEALAPNRVGQEQSNAVKPGGVKHTADKRSGVHIQSRWLDIDGIRKPAVLLQSQCVHGKQSASAVANHIHIGHITVESRSNLLYEIHSS